MSNSLWERWENKQETVKTQWDPTWESKSNSEHIFIQNKSKCESFSGILYVCVEVDRYCLRKWEKYSAEGKAEQNSIVLASFT